MSVGSDSQYSPPEPTQSTAAPGRSAKACRLGLVAAAVSTLLGAAEPVGEQDRVRWLGEMRHIAVLAPSTAASGAPLLLVLGDPGRSARYALESWRELAEREGFVVAAVSSADAGVWRIPQDGPGLLRAVVQRMSSRHQIDPRRVYLFGAGVGGGFALLMAVLQPQYFAAVASFGGEPQPGLLGVAQLSRALPVRIYFSKRTPQFDVDALQQAATALRESGAEVEVERLDVGPAFERQGHKAAGRIWAALSSHALSEGPRYRSTPYGR